MQKNREITADWITAETENGFTEICKLCEKQLMDETYCIWLMYLQDKYPGENNSEIAVKFQYCMHTFQELLRAVTQEFAILYRSTTAISQDSPFTTWAHGGQTFPQRRPRYDE